ncbi:DUF1615 domain-containing protein [Ahniella affigens]|uniref:DUF1615 domain-containing protein n=1 Tax=Ahniella affigens TaxID=2021234 RepID=A0A2P1PNX1_9GAMM|nr:DUF1615 domain-containing protein [Ahniella affigens]AVP96538.1 DUF1615 domain-containing protein [Ahniella affigens]
MIINPSARAILILSALSLTLLLGGCASTPVAPSAERTPEDIRAQLENDLLPANLADRSAWASDIEASFRHLDLPPSTDNLCAAVAVIEQETGFRANPTVPNLPSIARLEIERRGATLKIPKFAVHAALLLPSGNGQNFDERLNALRTEKDMSDLFDEMIAKVPLGKTLFASANPVHTGGSMQVSIAFAEQFAEAHGYPYEQGARIRDEVFTRRGGLYFGIAHLLKYPNSYQRHIYRYADFNAGWYASRNAAFQQVLSSISGRKLIPDGDLRIPERRFRDRPQSQTEQALLAIADRLDLSPSQIERDLTLEDAFDFEQTETYQRVFERADTKAGRQLPRAALPSILLKSPKITRKLTTEWFANRVQERYQQCINRAYAAPK